MKYHFSCYLNVHVNSNVDIYYWIFLRRSYSQDYALFVTIYNLYHHNKDKHLKIQIQSSKTLSEFHQNMDEFQLYTLLFTFLALFNAWYFTRRMKSGGKNNLPPSPPTLPVIGNLHQLGQLPHRSLWNLSRKYGPLMLLQFGSKPTLVVSSAGAAKEIMKTHDLAFAGKPVLSAPKKIFYDLKDLINLPYGDQWRKLRSIFLHELLSSTRVKSFNSIREEEIALLVEKIKDCCLSSRPVNLTNMFASLTNDLICRAAFGKKHSETGHGKKFLDSMEETVGLLFNFTLGEFIPWLSWINWLNGFNAALDRSAEKRDEILDAVIEDHLNRAPETTSSGQGVHDKSKENFVDILLGIYKGNTPGVSIDLISVKGVILVRHIFPFSFLVGILDFIMSFNLVFHFMEGILYFMLSFNLMFYFISAQSLLYIVHW